jgi:hypothetical protein
MSQKATIINALTSEVTEREMTSEEIAQHEKDTANSVVIELPSAE